MGPQLVRGERGRKREGRKQGERKGREEGRLSIS
jgi:hypothetical protein